MNLCGMSWAFMKTVVTVRKMLQESWEPSGRTTGKFTLSVTFDNVQDHRVRERFCYAKPDPTNPITPTVTDHIDRGGSVQFQVAERW